MAGLHVDDRPASLAFLRAMATPSSLALVAGSRIGNGTGCGAEAGAEVGG
jgi:hypothetical protein